MPKSMPKISTEMDTYFRCISLTLLFLAQLLSRGFGHSNQKYNFGPVKLNSHITELEKLRELNDRSRTPVRVNCNDRSRKSIVINEISFAMKKSSLTLHNKWKIHIISEKRIAEELYYPKSIGLRDFIGSGNYRLFYAGMLFLIHHVYLIFWCYPNPSLFLIFLIFWPISSLDVLIKLLL